MTAPAITEKFDIAAVIGRFEPHHKGHDLLISTALNIAEKVIIFLGSAYAARSSKNPFTWEERAAMISLALDEESLARVDFVPIRDCYDDAIWAASVKAAMKERSKQGDNIALVGHVKDASSNYLQDFRPWTFVEAPNFDGINATTIRHLFFAMDDWRPTQALLLQLMNPGVVHYLKGWSSLPHYKQMKEEYLSLLADKEKYGTGPFVTVDAVVTNNNCVLLIKRGSTLGKGLYAMPGGHLELGERVYHGSIRELREETSLSLLDSTLAAAFKKSVVFDHPGRSSRGHTITHVHRFELEDCRQPEVHAKDDAAEVEWVNISKLAAMESLFFEDHFHILDSFLAILKPEH